MPRPTTLPTGRGINFTAGPSGLTPAIPSPIKVTLTVIDDGNKALERWTNLKGNNIGAKLDVITFLDLEDGITETAGVNYADIEVLGRVEAFKNYVGNSNREFNLTFRFRAQGLQGKDLASSLDEEVVQPAKWIDALKFAITDKTSSGLSTGISHPPPRCCLQIGELFTGFVIVTDAQIIWQHPFDPETLLPYGAEVPTTLTVVRGRTGVKRIFNYDFRRGRR